MTPPAEATFRRSESADCYAYLSRPWTENSNTSGSARRSQRDYRATSHFPHTAPGGGPMPSAFDWDDHDDDALLVWEQPPTAVFLNVHGHVVIQQRGQDGPFVTVDPA